LESWERAKKRGAKVYGVLRGYGSTCDAYHRVLMKPDGIEPARAMTMAIETAGIGTGEIDYVNLHGTSTQLNDTVETAAVKRALGEHAYAVPTSATKSMIGHPQGACGAAGVAATLLALSESTIAPTINYENPDPACDLDYTPNRASSRPVRYALANCLAFGSKNSSLVIERGDRQLLAEPPRS
jgi:3-oxoacyl-[acyl-carrier-protein] synthase II